MSAMGASATIGRGKNFQSIMPHFYHKRRAVSCFWTNTVTQFVGLFFRSFTPAAFVQDDGWIANIDEIR